MLFITLLQNWRICPAMPFVFKKLIYNVNGYPKETNIIFEDFLHLRLGGNMESMNHIQYKPSITATIGTENMALTGGWP